MAESLSLFGDVQEPPSKKLPCFHCAALTNLTLIVVGAIKRTIPCCFRQETGCDQAAKDQGK